MRQLCGGSSEGHHDPVTVLTGPLGDLPGGRGGMALSCLTQALR